jgi:hypothetical protein
MFMVIGLGFWASMEEARITRAEIKRLIYLSVIGWWKLIFLAVRLGV